MWYTCSRSICHTKGIDKRLKILIILYTNRPIGGNSSNYINLETKYLKHSKKMLNFIIVV